MKQRSEIQEIAEAYKGVPIWFCMPDSPADRAGLRYGDICLEANGVRTTTPAKYAEACAAAEEKIVMRILRGASEIEIVINLSEGVSYSDEAVRKYVAESGIRPSRANPAKAPKRYKC